MLPSGWDTRVWNAKQCITLSPNGGYLGAPYVRGGCGIEEFHKRVIKLTPTHTPFKHPLGMCEVGIEEFSSIWTSLAPLEIHSVFVKNWYIWISFAFFEKYFYKENCRDWQIEGIGVDEPSSCLSSGRSLRPHSRCSAPFTLRLSLIGFLGNRQSCSVCARTRQLTGLFTWRQSHVAKEAVFNNYDQSTITIEWMRIQCRCSSVPQTGRMASSAVYYLCTQALCAESNDFGSTMS